MNMGTCLHQKHSSICSKERIGSEYVYHFRVKLWHCNLDENSKNPGAQQGYTSNGLQIDLSDAIVQILEECQ
jgi:hypothetical protein